MYLKELQDNWNTFGEEDPLWAVCAIPEKKNNNWDEQEFFNTGVGKISQLVQWMDDNNLPTRRSTALDFGCGVGRLTQALCDHFDWCVGVDIAPSMVEKAKGYNRHGKNCTYRLNESDDLQAFRDGTFDLIYTEHVLQHIRPQVALRYISEFIRVLRPGGLAFFHCPSDPPTYAYPPDGIACNVEATVESVAMEHMTMATIPIRVTNVCTHPIGMNKTINAPAKLIHHWLEPATGKITPNHGYLNLPQGVIEPGESIDLEYKAASPAEPGNYVLVLTPGDYFNRPATRVPEHQASLPVQVMPSRTKVDATTGCTLKAKRPRSESHTIPVDAVTAAVTAAGGRMVDIVTTRNAPGALGVSCYYATR